MSRRITLELPDEILNRAERLASLAHRDVADVLAAAVTAALPSLDSVLEEGRPVAELPDDEVLKRTELRLAPALDHRLSDLLDRQQAGTLANPEQTELRALIQVYETNLMRQAEALAEAVRRGLRAPLSP
jgi:hypothetical protein